MAELSEVRRRNLNAICLRRGWASQKNSLVASPSILAKEIGRTSSFWSDRLKPGGKPIGEDLAREIESRLQLGDYALDGISGSAVGWPFSPELRQAVFGLDSSGMRRAENVLRSHLGLEALPAHELGGGLPPGSAIKSAKRA